MDVVRNHREKRGRRPVRPQAEVCLDALYAALQAAQGQDPERIENPGRGHGSPGKARP